jgi:hypothetical protein
LICDFDAQLVSKFKRLQPNSLRNITGNFFAGTGNFSAGTGNFTCQKTKSSPDEVFGTHKGFGALLYPLGGERTMTIYEHTCHTNVC